jgi:futalosine hydrolase
VKPVDCEGLRAATRGCEVVLLVATGGEAAVLRRALRNPQEVQVATKEVVVGELAPLYLPVGSDGTPPRGRRVVLAITGCDKANTAHLLTCLLQAMHPRPRLVLQAGIAGALRAQSGTAGAAVGDVVVATQEAYSDTGSSSPSGWLSARELGLPIGVLHGAESGGVFPLDRVLTTAALEVLKDTAETPAAWPDVVSGGLASGVAAERPKILAGPCITSSLVTGLDVEADELAGRWGALAESMEGAAAAHMCALYEMPFLEVRGISNLVTNRNRAAWQVERAVDAVSWAARVLVDALDRLPLGQSLGRDAAAGPEGS